MPSAWGQSFGQAWGQSWGATTDPEKGAMFLVVLPAAKSLQVLSPSTAGDYSLLYLASTITDTTDNATHHAFVTTNTTGSTFWASVEVKAGDHDLVFLGIKDDGGSVRTTVINASTGVPSGNYQGGTTATTTASTDLGDGWFLFEIDATFSSPTSVSLYVGMSDDAFLAVDATGYAYAGTGATATVANPTLSTMRGGASVITPTLRMLTDGWTLSNVSISEGTETEPARDRVPYAEGFTILGQSKILVIS